VPWGGTDRLPVPRMVRGSTIEEETDTERKGGVRWVKRDTNKKERENMSNYQEGRGHIIVNFARRLGASCLRAKPLLEKKTKKGDFFGARGER